VLVVLAAIGGLAACNRTPSAQRVALDVIETLDVSESVKVCMRKVVETTAQDDVLEDFAKCAAEEPPDEAAEAALAEFEADLADCNRTG
jgi:hypothetical protein